MSKCYVKRLHPGEDLRKGILDMLRENADLHAGVVASAVGSLTHAKLRLAGSEKFLDKEGPFEIVSATGTVGVDGMHVHLAISDATGATWGGHLVDGCLVYTTVELVVVDVEGYRFKRTFDKATGYPELDPERK
jgi:predicted DNA-binding protein with PD1-like motif